MYLRKYLQVALLVLGLAAGTAFALD